MGQVRRREMEATLEKDKEAAGCVARGGEGGRKSVSEVEGGGREGDEERKREIQRGTQERGSKQGAERKEAKEAGEASKAPRRDAKQAQDQQGSRCTGAAGRHRGD